MSGGTCSIQTNKWKETIALLAKTWAIQLPCRLVWEKEKVLSKPTIDTVSFTISPMDEWPQSVARNNTWPISLQTCHVINLFGKAAQIAKKIQSFNTNFIENIKNSKKNHLIFFSYKKFLKINFKQIPIN